MRSDSLTLNSLAPVKIVSPSAQLAATNITGNSSIAKGTKCSGISIPLSFDEQILMSAISSPASNRSLISSILAPINRRISITPVLVGLTFTANKVISASFAILAATMKKAEDDMSLGTSILQAFRLPPPSIETSPGDVLTM